MPQSADLELDHLQQFDGEVEQQPAAVRLFRFAGVDPAGAEWHDVGGVGVTSPDDVRQQERPGAAALAAVVIADPPSLRLRDHLVAKLQVHAIAGVAMEEPHRPATEAALGGYREQPEAIAAASRPDRRETGHQFCRVMTLLPTLKVVSLVVMSPPKSL